MIISKWRIAAAVKRFPLLLTTTHRLIRLTRPRFTAGAVGVLFNPLGEVLLVEHVYHTAPQWGLPGGYVDRGEDPTQTVVREMREELELGVEIVQALVIERAAVGAHLDIAYLCQSDQSVGRLSSELLEYRWVSPDQLPPLRAFHRRAVSQALALMDRSL
jgi:ADP-ribose pyrophosphatase YjhB (NUDIX family)